MVCIDVGEGDGNTVAVASRCKKPTTEDLEAIFVSDSGRAGVYLNTILHAMHGAQATIRNTLRQLPNTNKIFMDHSTNMMRESIPDGGRPLVMAYLEVLSLQDDHPLPYYSILSNMGALLHHLGLIPLLAEISPEGGEHPWSPIIDSFSYLQRYVVSCNGDASKPIDWLVNRHAEYQEVKSKSLFARLWWAISGS